MKGQSFTLKSDYVINVSIERLWSILIDEYTEIGKWATSIPYSTPNPDLPEGDLGRVCAVSGFGEIKETVTHLDAATHSFIYKAEGMPFFIRHIQNAWTLTAEGVGTRVQAHASGELMPIAGRLLWPMMRLQMRRVSREFFEDLKYYAEMGAAHPRKVRQLKRAATRRVALP